MIAYFTRHPTAANLLMIVLMFLGLTALPKLKRETLPDITPNQLQVSAVYPGASAEEVEKAVVAKLEEAIDGVEFVKERRLQDQDVLTAAASASRERFRAIVLTSLTTIAGLLPLIFETNLQAQVLIPVAVSIAFGIMTSTVLVLLVVPSIYAVLADLRLVSNIAATGPRTELFSS